MKQGGIAVLALLLMLGACTKKKDVGEGLRGQEPCAGVPTPIAEPTFPTGFPKIGDVTWIADQKAGPSRVLNGYTGDALEDLFREMKEKFSDGVYSVTKDERDPHDAEVNFESATSTGQVRLGEECQGRQTVVITIRPKG